MRIRMLLLVMTVSVTGCASARCASGPALVSTLPVKVGDRVEIRARAEVRAPNRVAVDSVWSTGTIVALGDTVRIILAEFPDTISISRADVLAVHRSIGARGLDGGLKWFGYSLAIGVGVGGLVLAGGSLVSRNDTDGWSTLAAVVYSGVAAFSGLGVGVLGVIPASVNEGWECAPLPPLSPP